MTDGKSLLKVTNLEKWFPVRRGFTATLLRKKQMFLRAVDGISFEMKKGEILGLVGESGSGKTTTGRLVLRLIEPTGGKIYFDEKEITTLSENELKPLRRRMQMIFQDPYDSINPRMTIASIIEEPLRVQKILRSEDEIKEKVREAISDVDLLPPEEFLYRFPHELSGGQRQRVAIARAFAVDPNFLVADEPVSMLDVSIRAGVLDTMLDLVEKRGVSFLYITHDLALARHVCDRIVVMYLGKILETASTEKIIKEPLHPYTAALISAVPVPDPDSRRSEEVISGEIPSPVNPPSGCRFHTRCPVLMEVCRKKEPPLIDVGDERSVACHKHK